MEEEEDDELIKENKNKIIFNKYIVIKKLREGSFGDVYLGQRIEDKKYVAIKLEPRNIDYSLLEREAFLLYYFHGVGIPSIISYGRNENYNILIETLLGKSLHDIFIENQSKMSIEKICFIGKQVIERIKWVHCNNIIHRDIKPDNFLIGYEDPNIIYLIDFGLSKKYHSSITGKPILFFQLLAFL